MNVGGVCRTSFSGLSDALTIHSSGIANTTAKTTRTKKTTTRRGMWRGGRLIRTARVSVVIVHPPLLQLPLDRRDEADDDEQHPAHGRGVPQPAVPEGRLVDVEDEDRRGVVRP